MEGLSVLVPESRIRLHGIHMSELVRIPVRLSCAKDHQLMQLLQHAIPPFIRYKAK